MKYKAACLAVLCFASLAMTSARALAQEEGDESEMEAEEPSQPRGLLAASPTSQDEQVGTTPSTELPAVRARDGDLGMFFRFGGLASLVAGSNTRDVNGLLVSQVGVKLVFDEASMLPIYFGTGYRIVDPDGVARARSDWGFDIGAAYEYHFRIWRRISPFVGAGLGLGLSDPTGSNNLVFGIGLGPMAGVEYYIADRVSLTAVYLLTFAIDIAPDQFTAFSFGTLAGGAMNLTFYF